MKDIRYLSEAQLGDWLRTGSVYNPRPSVCRLVVYSIVTGVLAALTLCLAGMAIYYAIARLTEPLVMFVFSTLGVGGTMITLLARLLDHLDAWHDYKWLRRFMEQKYVRIEFAEVFKRVLTRELGKQLKRMKTPLPSWYANPSWHELWRKRLCESYQFGWSRDQWCRLFDEFKGCTGKYRVFALETLSDETIVEQIVRDNLSVIRLLSEAYRYARLPELEKQALIKCLQPSIRAIAMRADTTRRHEISDLQRRCDEIEARAQGRVEALQAQARGALGWPPKEAAARQAFQELEQEQAAQRKPSAKGKKLVKQLTSRRKKKSRRQKP